MKLKKYRNEIQKRFPGRLGDKELAKIYKMGITFDDAVGRLTNMVKREKLKNEKKQ